MAALPLLALPGAAELSRTSLAASPRLPDHRDAARATARGIAASPAALATGVTVTPARPLSLLDFVDVPAGLSAQDAIARSVQVAQAADRLGFARYWISEHHSFAGLASSSPEILIAHLAGLTRGIRVGAAGIMLPNHSPLKVAEWFKTLEMLHPGRIDLGLGRAPGTDQLTAFALRRSREALTADDFPQQAAELIAFLSDSWPDDHPFRSVLATPVVDTSPELLMLGSSGWGSAFAAVNGMTTVFAHHMAPELAVDALRAYRRDFRPGPLRRHPAGHHLGARPGHRGRGRRRRLPGRLGAADAAHPQRADDPPERRRDP